MTCMFPILKWSIYGCICYLYIVKRLKGFGLNENSKIDELSSFVKNSKGSIVTVKLIVKSI